jgi:hypothetical protein
MSNKTYMIIEADPDGDGYEIHKELKEAKDAFEERKKGGSFWSEGTLYLVEIKSKKFGFGTNGDIYGADIIEEHQFEQ